MLNDVYRGYMDGGYGATYPDGLRRTKKYEKNEDYALGVELASCAYFLTTSDTMSEWESDARNYNNVRDKINQKYPDTVTSPDEHFEYPTWEMRVFSSPDLQIARRVSFVSEFIKAKATEDERKSIIASSGASRFKIDYFNFIENPLERRIEELSHFEHSVKRVEKRYPGLLNRNLMDYVLDYHLSESKLLQVDTVFNVSEGSFLEKSVLRMLDIEPL